MPGDGGPGARRAARRCDIGRPRPAPRRLAPMDETLVDVEADELSEDHTDEELLVEEVSIDGMCGVY